ncbi:MAG: hypothetical protein AAB893_01450 [Patescibacteria group bacterium]
MKKLVFFLVFVAFLTAKMAFADDSVLMVKLTADKSMLAQKYAVYTLLKKYNSPMLGEVDAFFKACTIYQINCYLIPSIAGLESGFGKHIPYDSYNAFGWDVGNTDFHSWEDAIMTVARGLRKHYVNKEVTTVQDIAPIYAPPSTTWANNVSYFMHRLESIEETFNSEPLSF